MSATWEYGLRPTMELDARLDLSGTNAVITGGCSGIGLETARMLASRGATVVVGQGQR